MDCINDNKYKLILLYVNSILQNISKSEITDLTHFKDISRDELLIDTNEKVFEKHEKEIFKYYDKKKIGYYRRKYVQNYFLTFLKYSLRDIGYKITYREQKTQENKIVKITTYYSIVKI